nr:predicted protein [Triticum aestivum]
MGQLLHRLGGLARRPRVCPSVAPTRRPRVSSTHRIAGRPDPEASRHAAALHRRRSRDGPPVDLRRPSPPYSDRDSCITPTRRPRAMRRPIIAALPPATVGFILNSAAITPRPSGVPDLARDRLDHLLAAAIRLIYAARPTWPVGYARLRRSREDHTRVQRASPPIEHRAAAGSPRRAAAPPPRGSSPGCTDPRHRCVASSGRSAVTRGPPPPRGCPL